ncbi:MAG: MarR family transcriptional regulator [Anaerolineales bacterium]|nr:MarR family transcriptional regulator [Anaerolineales bacterium]MCX7608278.1 MarR family transcriptional regulator [Anaerolineales bacterium]MDW8227437.1 MarR family transcriptional regulator [Anaerolineales bacterium]
MNQELIDAFWESIPPVWRQTRTKLRAIAAERFGLTVEQFQALRRIRKGMDTVSALAEEGRLSRSQASRAVEALVRRGLVNRLTDERDRRHLRLSLTSHGEEILTAIFDEAEIWLAERFSRLSEAEATCLRKSLLLLRQVFSA